MTKRLFLIVSVSVIALTLFIGVLCGSLLMQTKDAVAQETSKEIVIERDPSIISNAQYAGYYLRNENAVAVGEAQYWGIRIKNLIGDETKIRFGFEFSGGNKILCPNVSTAYCYFVTVDGKVKRVAMDSAQKINVPGYFDGVLYMKGTEGNGYNSAYTNCTGCRLLYDFRNATKGKIAILDVEVANINYDSDVCAITDNQVLLNFDVINMSSTNRVNFTYMGGSSSDALKAAVSATKVENSGPVSMNRVDADAPECEWIVERKNSTKNDGANYYLASIQNDPSVSPRIFGNEEFWGISLKNLLNQKARIRFGFEMGGGVTCTIGSQNGPKAYLVSKDEKTVTEYTISTGQFVDLPANFDGTVYVRFNDCYNSNKVAVMNDGYRVKGCFLGFDYRNEYTAKLAVYGISVANVNKVDDKFVVSNSALICNFDNATVTTRNLGTVDGEIKTWMANNFSAVKQEILESIEITGQPAKKLYVVGDTFNDSGLVVKAKYVSGNTEEIDDYELDKEQLSVGDTIITVSYRDKTAEIEVSVLDFQMKEGAKLLVEGPLAIGFEGKILKADYDNLIAVYGEENVKLGIRIVRGNKYADVEATNTYEEDDYIYYVGAVMNILEENYKTDYIARAYVTVTSDGTTTKYYAKANNNTANLFDLVTEFLAVPGNETYSDALSKYVI